MSKTIDCGTCDMTYSSIILGDKHEAYCYWGCVSKKKNYDNHNSTEMMNIPHHRFWYILSESR